jgi:hypothetical protein
MLLRRVLLLLGFLSTTTLAVAGCGDGGADAIASDEEPLTTVSATERVAAQSQGIGSFTFDHLTPTSTKLMRAAHWWMHEQEKDTRYPKPRMCATNVSKVLFLAGLTGIDQEGVRNLIAEVKTDGGKVLKMPQDDAGFVAKLNALAGGAIPSGTLVAGMNVKTSAPGDQHIGFIGHTDPDGTVWIYHNNWYRPANENGSRKPFMVSEENLRRGFERQWMATPWLRIKRNGAGAITSAVSLFPALDDMDPHNPSFQVTLAILPEVVREL